MANLVDDTTTTTVDGVDTEVNTTPGLTHIDQRFIAMVRENRDFFEKSVSGSKMSMISMIKGKIRIINNSQIFNQTDFLASFESEILIKDSEVRDITLAADHVVFHLLSSTFTL
jgi:hypothetical protein